MGRSTERRPAPGRTIDGRPATWGVAGYMPSPEQAQAHADSARMKLIAGGERAGKSYSAAMELLARMKPEGGLYWIVGPTYELARPEFSYVAEILQPTGVATKISWPRQGACSLVTAWGTVIETRSSDDPVKLAGQAPDGVLMCEAAQHPYETWLRLRGRVAQRRGWLWASGTFEGSLGWYADLWQRWQADNPEGGKSFSLPSWSNLALYPGGRNDPEILSLEQTYPADLFQERFGAVPCPPATLVFREFSYVTHVSEAIAFDPALPVELAIDPGYAGAYAILAMQKSADGYSVNVIDEVYERGTVAQDMITLCQERDWWGNVRGGVIDVAGRQHQGLPSHVEVWRTDAGIFLRANKVGIVDGITRLRTFLFDPATGEPRIRFAPACRNTFAEFGRYKYAEVGENRPLREEPIDRDNHAMKALSYWLYDRYGPTERVYPVNQPGHDRFNGALTQHVDSGPTRDLVRTDEGGIRWAWTQQRPGRGDRGLRFR